MSDRVWVKGDGREGGKEVVGRREWVSERGCVECVQLTHFECVEGRVLVIVSFNVPVKTIEPCVR